MGDKKIIDYDQNIGTMNIAKLFLVYLTTNLCGFVRNAGALMYRSPVKLIRSEGHTCDVHEVQTEDGYILELHRVSARMKSKEKRINKPVLLNHGVLFSSVQFALNGKNNSLAFYLADLGYDVWLFNNRGNSVSMKHKVWDPDNNTKEFYDYSFHEIGMYDIPPVIDYILNETNSEQLSYIGYSQGGTSFYIMASTRPEYNKKISVAVLVAPSSIMRNSFNMFLNILSRVIYTLEDMTRTLGIYRLPFLDYFRRFFIMFSAPGIIRNWITLPAHVQVLQTQHVDETLLPKMYYYSPTYTSSRQLFHYGQLIHSGKFRQYDYGKKENLKRYNSTEPPCYDLEKVTAPIVLYYGDSDALVTEKDIEIVSEILPNLVYRRLLKGYQHSDFFNGVDQVKDFYGELADFLNKY
ncbi:unnamed protein product [Brassicogethes aeneus]|uniref:Lipase n=1 Tax=Brassicogethes aeneus TaxID=1431903 RepID=A0A9P0BFX7_BRAAE|nr:unnamed protein product [Brassicogethes aeneus]